MASPTWAGSSRGLSLAPLHHSRGWVFPRALGEEKLAANLGFFACLSCPVHGPWCSVRGAAG